MQHLVAFDDSGSPESPISFHTCPIKTLIKLPFFRAIFLLKLTRFYGASPEICSEKSPVSTQFGGMQPAECCEKIILYDVVK